MMVRSSSGNCCALQDLVNKSDSEKVLARRLGVGAEELERMVTARGREV